MVLFMLRALKGEERVFFIPTLFLLSLIISRVCFREKIKKRRILREISVRDLLVLVKVREKNEIGKRNFKGNSYNCVDNSG
jgi:hypothetical protein